MHVHCRNKSKEECLHTYQCGWLDDKYGGQCLFGSTTLPFDPCMMEHQENIVPQGYRYNQTKLKKRNFQLDWLYNNNNVVYSPTLQPIYSYQVHDEKYLQ